MTPEQHQQRIRQLEFKLEKADRGMGMPRDYEHILRLRDLIWQAKRDAELDAIDSDYAEQQGGY